MLRGLFNKITGAGDYSISAPQINSKAGSKAIQQRADILADRTGAQQYSLAATGNSPLALREAQRRAAVASQGINSQALAEQSQLEQNVAQQNAAMRLQADIANQQASMQGDAAFMGTLGTIGGAVIGGMAGGPAGAYVGSQVGKEAGSSVGSDVNAKRNVRPAGAPMPVAPQATTLSTEQRRATAGVEGVPQIEGTDEAAILARLRQMQARAQMGAGAPGRPAAGLAPVVTLVPRGVVTSDQPLSPGDRTGQVVTSDARAKTLEDENAQLRQLLGITGNAPPTGAPATMPQPQAPNTGALDVAHGSPVINDFAQIPVESWQYDSSHAAQANARNGLPPGASFGEAVKTSPMAQSLAATPTTSGAVVTQPDGMLGLDPGQLTATNTGAIAELARAVQEQGAILRSAGFQVGHDVSPMGPNSYPKPNAAGYRKDGSRRQGSSDLELMRSKKYGSAFDVEDGRKVVTSDKRSKKRKKHPASHERSESMSERRAEARRTGPSAGY